MGVRSQVVDETGVFVLMRERVTQPLEEDIGQRAVACGGGQGGQVAVGLVLGQLDGDVRVGLFEGRHNLRFDGVGIVRPVLNCDR